MSTPVTNAWRAGGVLALLLSIWVAGCGRSRAPWIGAQPMRADADALAVEYDQGSRELVLELKPVDLPANSDHHAVGQPVPLEGVIGVDGWVNGYRVELLDKDGQPVPQEVLHHVNIIVPGRRELFSQIMQRLGAAGHETAPVKLPRLIGYPLSRGDRVLLSAMVHNPTDRSYEGVRVRIRMPHIDRSTLARPIRVYPFYIDVMPPAGIHEFDLPPGHFEMAWEGKPAVSGRIFGVSGHVHRYASSLRLEDLTERKVMYETQPMLDADGTVTGMPQDMMWWRLGLPIRSDHTYRLTVAYDNPTGDTIRGGGMGALGGIMVATRGAEWPTIDPKHPEYIRDLAVTLRERTNEAMILPGGGDEPVEAPAGTHMHD